MKIQLHYFDIFPKVVQCNKVSQITIKPLGRHTLFKDDNEYRINIIKGNDNYMRDGTFVMEGVKSQNGILKFDYEFIGEYKYFIKVYDKDENGHLLCDTSVYAVKKDLYELRPYVGDLHVHSFFSDGAESPEFVMAEYRKNGFDFATLTDHGRYFPSLEAIEIYKDAPIDMLIVEGEEVHSHDNFVHIIHFGGEFSVNEFFNDNKEQYYKEVNAILDEHKLENNPRNFSYCASLWVFDKIKEAKGLSIFCHPFWESYSYQIPEEMIERILISGKFDAFELLGGQSVHENNMQTAFYNEQKSKHNFNIPVVGVSDSHGCFGHNKLWFKLAKTMVFAPKNNKNDLIDAIKNGKSVAMERVGDTGSEYRCYGDYRYVAYARFLLSEYFPLHDELCFEEGRAMHRFINNEENAIKDLEHLKGRTQKLMDKYFS